MATIYKTSASGKRTNTPIGHTASTRRCMTEQEMVDAGMIKNEQGIWIASQYNPGAHKDEVEEVDDSEEELDEDEQGSA